MTEEEVTFDDVFIDGNEIKVRREIADEIIALRMGTTEKIIDRIKAVAPAPGETVLVTTPSNVSQEFLIQVGDITKMAFPNNRIAVMPEGLELHTAEGLAELVGKSVTLATDVMQNEGVPSRLRAAATSFIEYIQQLEEKPNAE